MIVLKHSDLDGPILSKKSSLHQNGLQLNRKCLKFIDWYVGNFLVRFGQHFKIWTLFLAIFVKIEKSSSILGNFHFDFLTTLYQKVKNYFWSSMSNYRCHAIKCSYPKKLVWKSFLDIIQIIQIAVWSRLFWLSNVLGNKDVFKTCMGR